MKRDYNHGIFVFQIDPNKISIFIYIIFYSYVYNLFCLKVCLNFNIFNLKKLRFIYNLKSLLVLIKTSVKAKNASENEKAMLKLKDESL